MYTKICAAMVIGPIYIYNELSFTTITQIFDHRRAYKDMVLFVHEVSLHICIKLNPGSPLESGCLHASSQDFPIGTWSPGLPAWHVYLCTSGWMLCCLN